MTTRRFGDREARFCDRCGYWVPVDAWEQHVEVRWWPKKEGWHEG